MPAAKPRNTEHFKVNIKHIGPTGHQLKVLPHLILATACLTEVSDGRQFSVDWTPVEPAIVQFGHGPLRCFLITELTQNENRE